VKQVCIDFDFEEEKIDDYLHHLEQDEKYKNLPAFDWHTTMTKEQKAHERKRKLLEA
jgi:hypothetical protein